jgi:hypothetical protein
MTAAKMKVKAGLNPGTGQKGLVSVHIPANS